MIDAPQDLNIQHIVFLSVQWAVRNSFISHYKIEQLIMASGIPFTFLRPAYFMQNFLTMLKNDLIEKNKIFFPAGKAKFTLIDLQDVGEVCARILFNLSDHVNQSYDLTNAEVLSFKEMAIQLSEVLGRSISLKSPNLLSFFVRKKKEGLPAIFILVMIMLHFFPRFQKGPEISSAIQSLTGKIPKTFREFVDREKVEFQQV